MIGRAATSAVRRVCSMLAPASTSTPDPDLNQFLKRFTSIIIRHGYGDVNKTFSTFPGDPSVKYTASGEFSRSLEVETTLSDKPIFYLSRSFIGGYHYTPISVEDDGSLSPKRPIFVPSQFQRCGLLMDKCYNFNGVFFLVKNGPRKFVWNPTTSEIRELPVSPHGIKRMLGKVFTKYSVFVATWADPKSEDYKVLNVFSYGDGDYIYENSYPVEFELYSPKTDSWKKLRWEGEFPSWECRGRGCYINGAIYMKIYDEDLKEFILCFDFPSETFSTLALPAGIFFKAYELVKYNGQLSVFSLIKRLGPDEIEMAHWVRKNGEWVEVGVYRLYGDDLRRPLGFARNDELLLFQRYCRLDHLYSLMVFDSTTGELKLVPDCVSRADFLLLDFHDTTFLKL